MPRNYLPYFQRHAPSVGPERQLENRLFGEPNFNTLKTLDCNEAARVKPLVFRFES